MQMMHGTLQRSVKRQNGPPAGEAFHNLPRLGAPPLRILGTCLDYREKAGPGGRIYIGLWSKRSPGFALAYGMSGFPDYAAHAQSIPTIEDGIARLEQVCESLEDLPGEAFKLRHATLDTALVRLLRHHAMQSEVGEFLVLAGKAIARWEAWARPDESHPIKRQG